MVEYHELVGLQGEKGVGTPTVVRELDLEDFRGKHLDYCTHLASTETAFGEILHKRDDV
jgi:hypothetical protein